MQAFAIASVHISVEYKPSIAAVLKTVSFISANTNTSHMCNIDHTPFMAIRTIISDIYNCMAILMVPLFNRWLLHMVMYCKCTRFYYCCNK